MARILVPNGASKAVISSLRSLTRRGDRCDLASESTRRRGVSMYVSEALWLPSASWGSERFVEALVDLLAARPYDVIIPFTTDAVYALAQHAADLPADGPGFVVPPLESFLAVHDKAQLAGRCARLGIGVPRSFVVDEGNLADVASEVRYPVVVKARRSVGGGHGVRFAGSRSALLRVYREIAALRSRNVVEDFERPLVQEYVPGPVLDVKALALEGKVVNAMTTERTLMYPISGGLTAIAVTTRDHRLMELGRAILEELAWHGPADIEFKHDPADGRYKLIEINPRFWGSIDLSIRVGMDFPGMVRDYVLGEPVRPVPSYPAGVRYRYVLPRGVLATLQLVRELGLRAARDPHPYERTLYDVDLADWRFELRRVAETARALLEPGSTARSGLPPSQLPTPAGADWRRYA